MGMSYKEATEVLKRPDVHLGIWEDTVTLTSAYVEAIELALEALDKLDRIVPVGDVYPDWYERLSDLEYNYYCMEKNGEPWYRAKDVWACIEPISEEHREFGGTDGNT